MLASSRSKRVLLYSHDSFGLGHVSRCRTIANAIVEADHSVSVLIISGSMLVWPFLQGRLSRAREVGAVAATQLINRQNAVVLDLREPNEFAAGRLPNALHIPSSQLAARGQDQLQHGVGQSDEAAAEVSQPLLAARAAAAAAQAQLRPEPGGGDRFGVAAELAGQQRLPWDEPNALQAGDAERGNRLVERLVEERGDILELLIAAADAGQRQFAVAIIECFLKQQAVEPISVGKLLQGEDRRRGRVCIDGGLIDHQRGQEPFADEPPTGPHPCRVSAAQGPHKTLR